MSSNPFGTTINNAFVFFVMNAKTLLNSTMFSLTGSSTDANRWQSHCPYGGGTIYFDCGGVGTVYRLSYASGWANNRQAIMGFYCSTIDNVQQIYEDGVLKAGDATGHAITTVSFPIIGAGVTGSEFDACSIGEMIIVPWTVSTMLRQTIEGYLAHKWGLTGSLAASHPYKNAPPLLPAALPFGDLMSHWTFDDTTNDLLGVHNGTPNGAPTYAAGKSNNAIVLNGTSQDMSFAHAVDLEMNAWTFSTWLKLDASSPTRTNGIVGSRFGGDNTYDLKIDTSNGRIHGDIGNGTAFFTSAADVTYAFSTGVWYMLTATVGDGRYDYYLNGVHVGGGVLTGIPRFSVSGRTVHVGQSYPGEWFSGSLDEAYLFTRILRADEIAALYNAILVP
jgi:hypothetical protein